MRQQIAASLCGSPAKTAETAETVAGSLDPGGRQDPDVRRDSGGRRDPGGRWDPGGRRDPAIAYAAASHTAGAYAAQQREARRQAEAARDVEVAARLFPPAPPAPYTFSTGRERAVQAEGAESATTSATQSAAESATQSAAESAAQPAAESAGSPTAEPPAGSAGSGVGDVDRLNAVGREAFRNGKYAEAEAAWSKAILRRPSDVTLRSNRSGENDAGIRAGQGSE